MMMVMMMMMMMITQALITQAPPRSNSDCTRRKAQENDTQIGEQHPRPLRWPPATRNHGVLERRRYIAGVSIHGNLIS